MIQRSLFRQAKVLNQLQSRSLTSSISQFTFAASRSQTSYLPRISRRTPTTPLRTCESPRFYSAAAAESKPDAASAEESFPTDSSTQQEAPTPEDPMKKELDAKNKEIIDLKDKYLRSVADFRNLQDRTKRDVQAARDFAITRFAKDLIESIDNLDRALTMVPTDILSTEPASSSSDTATTTNSKKHLRDLHSGLMMTESILMSTLKKHGLERFDPAEKEEPFNPNLHEATFMTKMEGKEDGKVFMTQQKGFLLNGRVVRAAKVGVVKNS
ncbi:Mitochondrial matrix cochaperone [Agyrium rufum]|nr:Mitochondrial matrix cochaperone [Agyrium rufum]